MFWFGLGAAQTKQGHRGTRAASGRPGSPRIGFLNHTSNYLSPEDHPPPLFSVRLVHQFLSNLENQAMPSDSRTNLFLPNWISATQMGRIKIARGSALLVGVCR
ncbi:MAG: hypothetical protein ABI145_02500, partial [Steroidobacteraceae bacterium]